MKAFSSKVILIPIILILTAALIVPNAVHAATLTVSNTNDSGAGSLRQAILDANAGDTINFSVSGMITLASSLPDIDKELTIDGTGQTVSISGNSIVRIFNITAAGDLTLNNLTLQDGGVVYSGGGIYNNGGTLEVRNCSFNDNHVDAGGAIYNDGTADIYDSTFYSNEADDTGGGAIYNENGTLTVTDSTFEENYGGDYGGAIYNENGTVNVYSSTLDTNESDGYGGGIYFESNSPGSVTIEDSIFKKNYGSYGGGIYIDNDITGTITITNTVFDTNENDYYGGAIYISESPTTITGSTFKGNISWEYGGGIYVYGTSLEISNSTFDSNIADYDGGGIEIDYATVTVNNSTFYNNQAGDDGGGIDNYHGGLTVTNSTFSDNQAGAGDQGGGIFNDLDAVPTEYTELYNTIIADSTQGDCAGSGTLTADADNLDTDGSCDGATQTTGAALGLGALADNGGPTQTMAITSTSSAYDAADGVDDTDCTTNDQRGVIRPQDSACDVGAYEAGAEILTVTVTTPTDGAVLTASPANLTVIYSEAAVSDGSAKAANNTANYLLVEAGANGTFETDSCLGGVQTDDVAIALSGAAYNSGTLTATLTPASALEAGSYRLFVCGTTSVWSAAGLELNNGTSDATVDFTISTPATRGGGGDTLPATGFAPGMVTTLPAQPAELAYASTDLLLSIPELGVEMEIVGVPLADGEWDTSWLNQSAGWLEGSAFPTWEGNTILTGHVWDANNNPGPFAQIKDLQHGDTITITAWGQTYTYEVRESSIVFPGKVDKVFQHEEFDYLTLLTCEYYNPLSGNYIFRRVVRAVLVAVD